LIKERSYNNSKFKIQHSKLSFALAFPSCLGALVANPPAGRRNDGNCALLFWRPRVVELRQSMVK
jgi:hypothetical protein